MTAKNGAAILLPLLLLAAASPGTPGRREDLIRKIRDLGVYGDAVPVAGGRPGSGGEDAQSEKADSPEPEGGTAERDEKRPPAPSTPQRNCEER